jgi:hypothetical protein
MNDIVDDFIPELRDGTAPTALDGYNAPQLQSLAQQFTA